MRIENKGKENSHDIYIEQTSSLNHGGLGGRKCLEFIKTGIGGI